MAIQRDTKWNVILWGFFFLFYYYNWSSCFLFLPMWLTRMVGLDKTHIGMVFSSFAVAAICLQPLLGWVTDKLGPKKHLLWLIVILMVLFAPFFIYVYTPLLQSHFAIGLVVGGLYLGFIFHAGYGAVEAFVEKVSRNRGFEYGRPRLFGCFGSAACATISGILYGFDPTWIYWIGSALALLLVVILLIARSEPLPGIEAEQVRQQKVSVWELFKLRRFWYFTLYVLGVACIYDVFDQQFINFFTRFFDHQEQAARAFGYWVRLAEGNEGLHCQGIDIKEDPKEGGLRYDSLWRPCSASIICIEDMLFGFNLAEMTEYVPAKEINGRYIRDETMIRWIRGKYDKPFRYVIRHALPTGRFFLQLYSPYSSTNWQVEFRQTKQCGLESQIPKIISAMRDAVPLIKKQQEEARVKAEARRIQWELDEKRYREKERIRREKEAYNASLAELKAIMVQWAEDKRIEQFFREAESDVSMLEEKEKGRATERLSLARQFLSVDTAIERLLKWQTPQEILGKG